MTDITQAAIEHYDRMIEWAKKQNQLSLCESSIMRDQLGEYYGSISCVFCCVFCEKYEGRGCPKCPLYCKESGGNQCCDNLWKEMVESATWEEFIPAAEKVREYIREHGDQVKED